ncbi:hypothetical protein E2C01_060325 [Portunus trituberculatus]|uniref:Uncharacterized protein n=1 Tax=Portunus trituberculatus TaxID=210409 RepID=A0A5B7H8K3_PORTR|nr:hypothetical protein [Portunus trituberculatus]
MDAGREGIGEKGTREAGQAVSDAASRRTTLFVDKGADSLPGDQYSATFPSAGYNNVGVGLLITPEMLGWCIALAVKAAPLLSSSKRICRTGLSSCLPPSLSPSLPPALLPACRSLRPLPPPVTHALPSIPPLPS